MTNERALTFGATTLHLELSLSETSVAYYLSAPLDFWTKIPQTYRAFACALIGLGLIFKSTSVNEGDVRLFFFVGLLGFAMLAYGTILFLGST